MRRILLVASILLVTACHKHPTREKAEAACEHEIEIGFWKGFNGAVGNANDPETHKQGEAALVEQKQSKAWKDALAKCTDGAMDEATPEQVDCILAAKTEDESLACTGEK
jgi:hypothetical protein